MAQTIKYSYGGLKDRLRRLIFEGRQKMEATRLKTYWQAGRLLKGTGRGTLLRLSDDLDIEFSLLYRMVRFARTFPEPTPQAALSWSHYKELLSLPDKTKRLRLASEAKRGHWNVRRLRLEVTKRKSGKTETLSESASILEEPKQGVPGTYRVGWLQYAGGPKTKAVDFGFELYEKLSKAECKKFKVGDLITFNGSKNARQPGGKNEDLYTYAANVEKVVDGDTLLVHLQFSENYFKRLYLRLRGLNTEAAGTALGRKATRFVESKLGAQSTITFKSRRRDAYDRSIADVWIQGLYLNQALLDARLAHCT